VPRRINEDHQAFRDVYAGKIRKELKKFINNGTIFRTRGGGKKINITISSSAAAMTVLGEEKAKRAMS
jgi:hypothetical protein